MFRILFQMGTLYSLLVGPDLYRQFRGPERVLNTAESWGNTAMSFCRGIFYVSTSLAFGPVIFAYLYHRGWFTTNTVLGMIQYAGILVILAYGGRLVSFIFL